jgi:hypothetical protein
MTVVAALQAVFSELDSGALTVVGDHDVAEDGKNSVWCRHLHDKVSVMGYGHELGQHGSAKDGVIGGAEVRDLKRQVLRTEVLLCAKGDRQTYTTYGVCSLAGHDPVEGFAASGYLVEVEVHLSDRLYEDDVQAAALIDEGLRQERPIHYGVDDQRVGPGVWYVDLMIFTRESDWVLRPAQRLWSFSVDVPDLPCV